jgi:DNA-binding NtrC family response regulator
MFFRQLCDKIFFIMLSKVLIVDDSPAIREILSMYVESFCEPEILTAETGNSAIELLKSIDDIDLVVSDFNMLDGTGGDLYKFLRSVSTTMPFILQTAEPIDLLEEFENFPNSNSEGFLQKPFSIDEVEELLEQVSQTGDTAEILEEKQYRSVPIDTFLKY